VTSVTIEAALVDTIEPYHLIGMGRIFKKREINTNNPDTLPDFERGGRDYNS